MNNFNFEEFTYDDMMPFNNITLPNMDMLQNPSNHQMNSSNMQTANLATPNQAYVQGNLFNNLYQGYKNYRPFPLVARNEQEQAFLNYSQLAFAAHEVNLYLDNYPNDRSMIRLYNDYREATLEARRAYEQQYGPITVMSDTLNNFPWLWQEQNFPWDEGGM